MLTPGRLDLITSLDLDGACFVILSRRERGTHAVIWFVLPNTESMLSCYLLLPRWLSVITLRVSVCPLIELEAAECKPARDRFATATYFQLADACACVKRPINENYNAIPMLWVSSRLRPCYGVRSFQVACVMEQAEHGRYAEQLACGCMSTPRNSLSETAQIDMGSLLVDADKPHAVCVPFPAQGHVTPMLKLAKILHRRGFHVTFVNSEFNHRRLLRSRGAGALDGLPGFRFATIPDGLPPSDADATQDVPSLCRSTLETCLPHFKNLLADLNASPEAPPVTCIVSDDIMSFTLDAAREISVPCALFWTASACGYIGYRHYRTLTDKGIFPLKDAEQLTNGFLDTPVDWATGMSRHMRLKDFPSFFRSTDPDEYMVYFALHVTERLEEADAVVLNTFDELEPEALDAMRAMLPPAAPIHTVGPLAFLAEETVPRGGPLDELGSNLWKEDVSCFDWLDGKEPGSVVYVNYGSITVMTNEELVEFAWGLANSGHAFLWIIRPDLVKGDAAVLPPEFLESIKGRGLLASWCPQEEVLRHEAVGVFLTHSGWNSTMESLCCAVPMLCWPFFAEQQTNCRYKCVEWGVAMEIGHDVRREAVEDKIREAMGGEKGRAMRLRAAEWRETGVRATRPGGHSYANLEKLVADVLLSARDKKC